MLQLVAVSENDDGDSLRPATALVNEKTGELKVIPYGLRHGRRIDSIDFRRPASKKLR